MSDIQLFRLENDTATELTASAAVLERNLQRLIEGQMETFLGVRSLATEYATGTGDLELCLRNNADLERAKPLLERAYQEG